MKSGNVLCAIDVHDFDQQLVDMAAMFANQYGVPLDLLHVTWTTSDNAKLFYLGPPEEMTADHHRLSEIEASDPQTMVRRHHLFGSPVEQILGFAERNQPRLLVVGTHGRTGLARLFGSVATELVRKATCPVMVLRQRKKAPAESVPSESQN